MLDAVPRLAVTSGPIEAAPLAGYLLIAEGVVRLWGPVRERFDRARTEFEQKAQSGLSEGQPRVGRPAFSDVVAEALIFPVGASDEADAERRIQASAQEFYEENLSPLFPCYEIDYRLRRSPR